MGSTRCTCHFNHWVSQATSSLGLCDPCLALFARDDLVSVLKSGIRFTRRPYDPRKTKCSLCSFVSAQYFTKSIIFPNSDGGDDDFLILRKFFSWLGRGEVTCNVRGDLKTDQSLELRRWDGWWPLKTRYLKLSATRGQYTVIFAANPSYRLRFYYCA